MTDGDPQRSASPRRWWMRRTLRAQLVAGVLLLLVVACATVGLATTLALRGFLVRQLDQQLADAGSRFATSLDHRYEREPDEPGGSPYEGEGPDPRGQAVGTFAARLVAGAVTDATVIRIVDGQVALAYAQISKADLAQLTSLPTGGDPASIDLTSLGHYRVSAVRGSGGDVLIAGLPLSGVNDTVRQLGFIEIVVFLAVLTVTGLAGAGWVRLTLRPLRRVAATAREVTKLPLASGEVALPPGVPGVDPRTEVGQVGAAVNHMLAHVEAALAERHATEERLRQFIADASHELRTPLAAIRGHAEFARRDPRALPPEVSQALLRVESEAARMGGLVDDLLLLARLDAGRPLICEPVDLSRLVIDGTSDARVAGPSHRWVLDLPEEPVVVDGDEHRLHQAVSNLLGNARVHTPAGTTVTVRVAPLRDHSGEVELSVTDDGPGIPADLQPSIFERFVRADASRSRRTGSTGLGLAIVAAVVNAHGGGVTVDSQPGRTRFRILLPAGGAAIPSAGDVRGHADSDGPARRTHHTT